VARARAVWKNGRGRQCEEDIQGDTKGALLSAATDVAGAYTVQRIYVNVGSKKVDIYAQSVGWLAHDIDNFPN
jgi:hypothetical protein